MRGTAAWPFGVPPLPNAPSVELAETLHPPQLVARLEFFEADDALDRLP